MQRLVGACHDSFVHRQLLFPDANVAVGMRPAVVQLKTKLWGSFPVSLPPFPPILIEVKGKGKSHTLDIVHLCERTSLQSAGALRCGTRCHEDFTILSAHPHVCP